MPAHVQRLRNKAVLFFEKLNGVDVLKALLCRLLELPVHEVILDQMPEKPIVIMIFDLSHLTHLLLLAKNTSEGQGWAAWQMAVCVMTLSRECVRKCSIWTWCFSFGVTSSLSWCLSHFSPCYGTHAEVIPNRPGILNRPSFSTWWQAVTLLHALPLINGN